MTDSFKIKSELEMYMSNFDYFTNLHSFKQLNFVGFQSVHVNVIVQNNNINCVK